MVIWAILLVFIGLIIFQNQEFFLSKQILRVNLGIVDVYESPQVPVAIVFLVFFFFGVILAYLFSLPERFKTNKILKKLKTINTSLENELANLKRDVAALKGEPVETKEEPEAKAGESAAGDIAPIDDAAENLSDDTAAEQSESAADPSDESRLEADDESKKSDSVDNSNDSSIEKNT